MMEPVVVLHPVGDDPPKATLWYGLDVREALRKIPSRSVQAICTSPPYWGLRDYGVEPTVWGGDPECVHSWKDASIIRKGSTNGRKDFGSTLVSAGGEKTIAPGEANDREGTRQRRTDRSMLCRKCGAWLGSLGQEPHPRLYVEHLAEVFEEAKRVLRDDGTLWLNLGDTYAANRGFQVPSTKWAAAAPQLAGSMSVPDGFKPKDLLGIPWRVAFALQEKGWWLRSDIVWAKPNALPSSVTDRCSSSHEFVFLLAKARRYFFDHHAIREPASRDFDGIPQPPIGGVKHAAEGAAQNRTTSGGSPVGCGFRNKRDVWTVTTQPFEGAHFATWPPDLARLMIQAGTSEKGRCSKCGAPWKRIVKKGEPDMSGRKACGSDASGGYSGKETKDWSKSGAPQSAGERKRNILEGMRARITSGWEPSCKCRDADPVRCVVLDIFSGSGTTGMVAFQENRDFIGIDLNPAYLNLAKSRITEERFPDESVRDDCVLDLF